MSRVTDGEARVIALQAGSATVETINPAQCRHIDDPEVGRQVCRNIRAAFAVTDVNHAIDIVARAGVELVAAPTETPWRILNARHGTTWCWPSTATPTTLRSAEHVPVSGGSNVET
jgi:hypothetical protein